jgi:hypothetical protein
LGARKLYHFQAISHLRSKKGTERVPFSASLIVLVNA